MIKSNQYKQQNNVSYVTMAMIKGSHTKREIRNFKYWFGIQTTLTLSNSEVGIFIHDYERWLEADMPESDWN